MIGRLFHNLYYLIKNMFYAILYLPKIVYYSTKYFIISVYKLLKYSWKILKRATIVSVFTLKGLFWKREKSYEEKEDKQNC